MLGIGLGFTSRGVLQRVGVPLWEPITGLGAALKFWIHADDHGTARMVDDGAGLISSWTDKVGGLVAAGVTAARPTWSATSADGKAGVTGDGVANALTSASLGTLPTGATGGEMWLSVSQLLAGATAGIKSMMAYGAATAAAGRLLQRTQAASVNRFILSDISTFLTDTVTDFSGASVVQGAWTGTTETARINGAATTPASATIASLNTGTLKFGIFANNSPTTGGFANVTIRQGLITTTLTALQRQQLEGYLAWDWGATAVAKLPGGHPYKLAPP